MKLSEAPWLCRNQKAFISDRGVVLPSLAPAAQNSIGGALSIEHWCHQPFSFDALTEVSMSGSLRNPESE